MRHQKRVETLKTPPQAPKLYGPRPNQIPITGDGHANALYIIHQLVMQGVIQLPDAAYHRLQEIYFQEVNISHDDLNEFINLMHDSIEAIYFNQTIILDGDLFFDRGRNCLLMIELIKHLQNLGIHTIMNFGNHDYWLFEYLFAEDMQQHLYDYAFDHFIEEVTAEGGHTKIKEVARERAQTYMRELTTKIGEFNTFASHNKQGRSADDLKRMIASEEFPSVTRETLREDIIRYIFPNLELVSVIHDEESQTFVTSTHARTSRETFYEISKTLGVVYDDHSPKAYIATIQAINAAWRHQCLGRNPSILPPRELAVLYNDGYHVMLTTTSTPECVPVFRIAHNRTGNRRVYQLRPEAMDGFEKQGAEMIEHIHSDQLLYPACLSSTPSATLPLTSILKGKLLWKKTHVIECHGHESFMPTKSQAETYTSISNFKKQDQARNKCIVATPFNSPLHDSDAAPFENAAAISYASYDRCNLDASTLGRQGHPYFDDDDLSPIMVYASASGKILSPVPENIEAAREGIRENIKVILLQQLMQGCRLRLETLIRKLDMSTQTTHTMQQRDELYTLLTGPVLISLGVMHQYFELIKPEDVDRSIDNFLGCKKSVTEAFPQHPWAKSTYKKYIHIKQAIDNAMELPTCDVEKFLHEQSYIIFGERVPSTPAAPLTPSVPSTPSIWLTSDNKSELPQVLLNHKPARTGASRPSIWLTSDDESQLPQLLLNHQFDLR